MGKTDLIATSVLVALLALLAILAFIFWSDLAYFFRLKGGVIGDACTLHTDCADWGPGNRDVACCKGKCTRKEPDWAGVGWCPDVCKGWPSTTNTYGTCDQTKRCPVGYIRSDEDEKEMCCPSQDGIVCDEDQKKCSLNQVRKDIDLCSSISGLYHWPRLEGEVCVVHTDCEGWGPGPTDMACCSGVCKRKQKDWTGVGWCPDACRGWSGAPSGTCDPDACPRGFVPHGNGRCCRGKVVNGMCQGTECSTSSQDPTQACALYSGVWHTPRRAGEECSDIRACAPGLGCCPGLGAFNPPGIWAAPRVCTPLIDGKCPQNVNTGCQS